MKKKKNLNKLKKIHVMDYPRSNNFYKLYLHYFLNFWIKVVIFLHVSMSLIKIAKVRSSCRLQNVSSFLQWKISMMRSLYLYWNLHISKRSLYVSKCVSDVSNKDLRMRTLMKSLLLQYLPTQYFKVVFTWNILHC